MPSPPPFGDQDYQQAMQRLQPKGRAWRGDAGSMLSATLLALAPTYTRCTAAAAQLLIDAFVATTVNLLPEWEESLGLPDACTPANPTIEARQAAVRAKWGERGGQSISYFIKYAAALGYAITIQEFAPFTVGMPVGLPLAGPAWAFAWQVNALTFTVQNFEVGHDSVGEPLATWGGTVLQCELQRLAPAHTVLIFNYSSDIAPTTTAVWGEFVWGAGAVWA
jgi:uncharacterized protein YmfQ (DUF2313 family)